MIEVSWPLFRLHLFRDFRACVFCVLQVKLLCWWTVLALPLWWPVALWSASSWTGPALSVSWVPVQTFSNVTSNSTTALSRCLSERAVALSTPSPPSLSLHPSPFFSPLRPRVHQCNLLSVTSSLCSLSRPPPFVLHKQIILLSHRGDFQPFTSACTSCRTLLCRHSYITLPML